MELPKNLFICVVFLMSREMLCQNIDSSAVHHTIKDQGKHVQKRDHQSLIPQILKLGQPITLSKQRTQSRPQRIQEVRTQMIPRQTLHEIPRTLQQRSQSIQQRPINLRLNPAKNLQRRVTNVTRYPIHNNNATDPSIVPHSKEPKENQPKDEIVSTPVPNDPVVHILISKETPDKNHKTTEFFVDDDEEKNNTSTHHPEYLNKIPVKDLNKHDSKVQYLDNRVANKKPDKTHLNNAEIKESNSHDGIKYENENLTNKKEDRNKGKLNAMDDDQYAIDDEDLLVRNTKKDNEITENKPTHKQPVPKTIHRTDSNKNQNKLTHSLTRNNYTGDNIISVKARKGENRNKDISTDIIILQNFNSTQPIQNDKIDNVLIQNHTYEEIYERSINSNPSVLYNKRYSNMQTPEYSTYTYQDNIGENKFPTEDYSNQVPSTSNIKCVYNRYTNSYEVDPNLFLNQNKQSVEYMNENQINSGVYDKQTHIIADYYPREPENYIDRIWRTWRNSEVRINNNNNKPINENMDYKQDPGERIKHKEPVNAVTNLIGVNGCYENQNIPVACRYCPSYQCYY